MTGLSPTPRWERLKEMDKRRRQPAAAAHGAPGRRAPSPQHGFGGPCCALQTRTANMVHIGWGVPEVIRAMFYRIPR